MEYKQEFQLTDGSFGFVLIFFHRPDGIDTVTLTATLISGFSIHVYHNHGFSLFINVYERVPFVGECIVGLPVLYLIKTFITKPSLTPNPAPEPSLPLVNTITIRHYNHHHYQKHYQKHRHYYHPRHYRNHRTHHPRNHQYHLQ